MNKVFIVNYLGRDCYEEHPVLVKVFKELEQAKQWIMQREYFWEYEIVEMKVEK